MLVVHGHLKLPKGQRVTCILMIYHDISIRVVNISTASSYFPLRYHLRIIWTINIYGWWSEPSMLHFPSEENWQGNHVRMTRGPSWFILSSLWRRDCHPVVGFHWKGFFDFLWARGTSSKLWTLKNAKQTRSETKQSLDDWTFAHVSGQRLPRPGHLFKWRHATLKLSPGRCLKCTSSYTNLNEPSLLILLIIERPAGTGVILNHFGLLRCIFKWMNKIKKK